MDGLDAMSFGTANRGRKPYQLRSRNLSIRNLKFLGRIHSVGGTPGGRGVARTVHGFERINLDLIFAVPGQTIDDVRNDIAKRRPLAPRSYLRLQPDFEDGRAFFTNSAWTASLACRLRPGDM